jgi:dihydrofolate synthase/folylpolyglutamate synthase
MNYQETLDYMFASLPMFHRVGAAAYKADLSNTIRICSLLGNPQQHFKTIHIAGTNGKGSVSHMLASILQQKGLKTGLYTSPHLKDFRERIRVNGRMIGKTEVTRFIQRHKGDFERIHPSFFEMTVGMAFQHFREQKVDIAVIETGLGGRLDSTNIIHPMLSVITNVSFDHMQFLGDSLVKIAAEKAGIIKPGVPALVGETQPETCNVFTSQAAGAGTTLRFADASLKAANVAFTGPPQNLISLDIFRNGKPWLAGITSPLAGQYQLKNIVTVAAACEELRLAGIPVTDNEIRSGIAEVIVHTGLAGRWQVLSLQPLTICDTGHNEGGLREVLQQIDATPHDTLHFVFGLVNDKAVSHLLAMLPARGRYYFCKADIPRGMDAHELQEKAAAAGLHGAVFPSVKAALKAARQNAGSNDLVFVGGSTFVVAEVV